MNVRYTYATFKIGIAMHLISMQIKLEITEVITKYLNTNEIDVFAICPENYFILTERYPNDVLVNCKNYLELLNIKFIKNMVIVSTILNANFSKAEFDRLKKSYKPS